MIEFRKKPLLSRLLSGETFKTVVERSNLSDVRRPKFDPPRLITRKEAHGVRINLQERPPIPAFKTLAFVANSGKITYYAKESTVKPEYKMKIERLSKIAQSGKRIGL